MGLGQFFRDLDHITHNNAPDYPVLLFKKILDALPSLTDFSLQMFISSWNLTASIQNRATLGQYEDVLIFDTLMGVVEPYLKQLTPPLFTKYGAKFFCQICHVQYTNITEGQFRSFKCVPVLSLPVNSPTVSPGQMLTDFLDQTFDVSCPRCQNRCSNAVYEVTKGRFTPLAFNRRGYRDSGGRLIPKLMTQFSVSGRDTAGDGLCGELVSVICHLGDPNAGHWVSYHHTDDGDWWMNDDSRPMVQSRQHPYIGRPNMEETVDFVLFKNQ